MIGVEESEMIPDFFWYIVMSIITYGVIANEVRAHVLVKAIKDNEAHARVQFDKEAGR